MDDKHGEKSGQRAQPYLHDDDEQAFSVRTAPHNEIDQRKHDEAHHDGADILIAAGALHGDGQRDQHIHPRLIVLFIIKGEQHPQYYRYEPCELHPVEILREVRHPRRQEEREVERRGKDAVILSARKVHYRHYGRRRKRGAHSRKHRAQREQRRHSAPGAQNAGERLINIALEAHL